MTKSGFNFAKAIGANVLPRQKASNTPGASSSILAAPFGAPQKAGIATAITSGTGAAKPIVRKPAVSSPQSSNGSDTSHDDIPDLLPAGEAVNPAYPLIHPSALMCELFQKRVQENLQQVQAYLQNPDNFEVMKPHIDYLMKSASAELAHYDDLAAAERFDIKIVEKMEQQRKLANALKATIEAKAAEDSTSKTTKKKKKKQKKKKKAEGASNAAEPAGSEANQDVGLKAQSMMDSADSQVVKEELDAQGSKDQIAAATDAVHLDEHTLGSPKRSSEASSQRSDAECDSNKLQDSDGWGSSDEDGAVEVGGDSGNMFALLAAFEDGGDDAVDRLASRTSRRRRRTGTADAAAASMAQGLQGNKTGSAEAGSGEQDARDADAVSDQAEVAQEGQGLKQRGPPAVQTQWQQQFAGLSRKGSSSHLQAAGGLLAGAQVRMGAQQASSDCAGDDQTQLWDGAGQAGYRGKGPRGGAARGRGRMNTSASEDAVAAGFCDQSTDAQSMHFGSQGRGRGRGRGRHQHAEFAQHYLQAGGDGQGEQAMVPPGNGQEDMEYGGHVSRGRGRGRGTHNRVYYPRYANNAGLQQQAPLLRPKMTYQELHAKYYAQQQQRAEAEGSQPPHQGDHQFDHQRRQDQHQVHPAGKGAQPAHQQQRPTWQQQELMHTQQQHGASHLTVFMHGGQATPKEQQPTWQQQMLAHASRPQRQGLHPQQPMPMREALTTASSTPPPNSASHHGLPGSGYPGVPPPPPRAPAGAVPQAPLFPKAHVGAIGAQGVHPLYLPMLGAQGAHSAQASFQQQAIAPAPGPNTAAPAGTHANGAPASAHASVQHMSSAVHHMLSFTEQPAKVVSAPGAVGDKHAHTGAVEAVGQEADQTGGDEEERVPECCVCLEEMPNCVLRPCGHPLCSGCYPLVMKQHGTCPMCRTVIEDCLTMWA